MRVRWTLLIVLWAASLAGAQPITTLLADWKDAKRNVTVPVKIYYPQKIAAPAPAILVSHGLGGNRESMRYAGEYWASHGYISIHLQHVGSDTSVLTKGPPADAAKNLLAAASVEQFLSRNADVKFALDELERLNTTKSWQLYGKFDLDKIAMAGHSFGAITTLAICGQTFPMVGKDQQPSDKRIKCGIAFSPSPPRMGDAKTAFADVKIPMFHMTGTRDSTPIPGDASPAERRVPFDNMNGSDQYLVIFKDGDHMIFNGRLMRGRLTATDRAFKSMIEEGTTAFLDAYLKGDQKAKDWLAKDAKTTLGKNGTVEMKTP
jgi:predicted dienelactone hydrolase